MHISAAYPTFPLPIMSAVHNMAAMGQKTAAW